LLLLAAWHALLTCSLLLLQLTTTPAAGASCHAAVSFTFDLHVLEELLSTSHGIGTGACPDGDVAVLS
jgi:hypothetical protein